MKKGKANSGDLRVVVHRPGVTLFWRLALVVVCFAIWGVGFLVGGWDKRQVPTQLLYEEREHLLAKIIEYRKRIGDLEIQLAQKQVELDIAQVASGKIRDDYRRLYEQLDKLEAEVSNYKRVLKPNAGEQGVIMGLLDLTPAEQPRQVTFSLDFFQSVDRRKISGDVKMQLRGKIGDEIQSWDFAALAVEKPLHFKLGFMHYQTISGTIELPEGVQPIEIVVEAEITAGKQVNLSKVFRWTLED